MYALRYPIFRNKSTFNQMKNENKKKPKMLNGKILFKLQLKAFFGAVTGQIQRINRPKI